MPAPSAQHVTRLLQAWGQGEDAALEELLPLVHQELRRLARRYMCGERPGHTLQTTALVNEAYLRLVNSRQVNWQNRAHFFCHLCPIDATNTGGLRPRARIPKARW